MPDYEVRLLADDELAGAAALYGRAFSDQPTILEAVRGGPQARARFVERAMRAFLPHSGGRPISAWQDGRLVGVLGMQPPGRCRLSVSKLLRVLPRCATLGEPRAVARLTRVLHERDRHDAREPHIHLEPLAVDPLAHGQGVAVCLFEFAIERSEHDGVPLFAIADKARMATFGRFLGFDVVDRFDILGIPHVAGMRRPTGAPPPRERQAPRIAIGSA